MMNLLMVNNQFATSSLRTAASSHFSDHSLSLLLPPKEAPAMKHKAAWKRLLFFEYSSLPSLFRLRKEIRSLSFDAAVLPRPPAGKDSFFHSVLLFKHILFLFLSGIPRFILFDGKKERRYSLLSYLPVLFISIMALLLSPLFSFLYSPVFLFTGFLPALYYTLTNPKSFFGFRYMETGAHLYYLAKAKMAKRYGLFGINHQDYMGTPVTLHRSPLDTLLLRLAGYGGFLVITLLLLSSFFTYLAYTLHEPLLYLLIPFLFLSTYFIKSVLLGHTEFLAWTFFLWSLYLFYSGNILLSAVFFSLAVLSHIGISLLLFFSILFLASYRILALGQYALFSDMLIYSLVVLLLTAFFIIPFLRTTDKLGRGSILNSFARKQKSWSFSSAVPLLCYLLFLASFFIFVPFQELHMLALLPLLVLIFNTKVSWAYSQYTIELSMLFTGAFVLFLSPHLVPLILFFYLIFRSPLSLSPDIQDAHLLSYSFTPVTLGSLPSQLRKLLSSLPKGARIALESYERDAPRNTSHVNAFFSCLFVDQDHELLNGFAPEFVEPSIYFNSVRHLHEETPKKKLETILKDTGTRYLFAYSPSFRIKLLSWGYKEKGSLSSPLFEKSGLPHSTITLLEAPFAVSLISPFVPLHTSPNRIEFPAQEGKSYFIRYNHAIAWKAFQGGKRLTIIDRKPGMLVHSPSDGKITLKYNYMYYWLPE